MRAEEFRAVRGFAALAHPTRLQILAALIAAQPNGMAAGAVGEAVGAAPSRTSFHLAYLERAGLIWSLRRSRSMIYSVDDRNLASLAEFIVGFTEQSSGQIDDIARRANRNSVMTQPTALREAIIRGPASKSTNG